MTFLADSFTSFTEPGVGRAAIELLEAAGHTVRLESGGCCGRASLSKGLVDDARKQAGALARRQLALGDETVTNLDHETIGLDERMRWLVELADGTRDREALARDLGTKRQLGENLDHLARLALLEG